MEFELQKKQIIKIIRTAKDVKSLIVCLEEKAFLLKKQKENDPKSILFVDTVRQNVRAHKAFLAFCKEKKLNSETITVFEFKEIYREYDFINIRGCGKISTAFIQNIFKYYGL